MRPETWAEVLRVMKPGAHLVAFGGTRTYHRMVCAIEDAGFEIRDQLAWLYGSGFPKSHDIGKAIDKAAGAEREVVEAHPYAARKPNGTWTRDVFSNRHHPDNGPKLTAPATPEAVRWAGWGTALKPSHEPVLLAQNPLTLFPHGIYLRNRQPSSRQCCGRLHLRSLRLCVSGQAETSATRTRPVLFDGLPPSSMGRGPPLYQS
jgi:hypothetical protein